MAGRRRGDVVLRVSQGSARLQSAARGGQGARADPAGSRDRFAARGGVRAGGVRLPAPDRSLFAVSGAAASPGAARPVATVPKPQPAPNETPPAPALRLSQILTPEESRRNNQELDQYTDSAKKALTRVAGRNLDAGAEGYCRAGSDLPDTSRAGARARSSDGSQPGEACRSPRQGPSRSPALIGRRVGGSRRPTEMPVPHGCRVGHGQISQ